MNWRYCMAKDVYPTGEVYYSIRELYTDDGGGISWTNPITPHGDTITELRADMAMMSSALVRDTLDLTLEAPALVKMLK